MSTSDRPPAPLAPSSSGAPFRGEEAERGSVAVGVARPVVAFVAVNLGATALFLTLAHALDWAPNEAGALQLPFIVTPSVSALALALLFYGEPGVEELMRRLRDTSAGPAGYALAIGLFPALASGALVVQWLHPGLETPAPRVGLVGGLALLAPLALLPGLGEELGWRGFLAGHLQRRWNGFAASLLVGVVWWLWHGLSIAVDPARYAGWGYLVFGIYVVPTAVLIGWVVNRGRGSLQIAIVAHFGANLVNFFFPLGNVAWGIYFAILWLVALIVGGVDRRVRFAWPSLPPPRAS